MSEFPQNMGAPEKPGADFVAKPLPKKKTEAEPNLLDRFVYRIRNTFFHKPDKNLSGRVQQLKDNTDEVLKRLENIKKELRNQVDVDLYKYIESVIDPMTRDVRRIQKLMEQQGSVLHQARAYKKYSDWIEKAKLWVELESRMHDKEAVIQAIVKHTFAESDELIDQDLQVISDYELHTIGGLAVSDEEKNSINTLLRQKLAPHIHALNALKQKPQNLELRKVTHWRAEVDRKRNQHFDNALHEIDEVIQEIAPLSASEEEHEHMLELFKQIASLEEEIPKFLAGYETDEAGDEELHKLFLNRVTTFQQEIHNLNLDLRLTPELYERLQILTVKLEQWLNEKG